MTETLPETAQATDLNEELTALVRRYQGAAGPGLRLLNALGSQAENLIDRIPGPVRGQLEAATKRGLEATFGAAAASRGRVPDGGDWFNTALTTAMGAAGGFGGLPSALAEVPVTTTVLMRAIQSIAEEHGFDPDSEEVRLACLDVFAAAGPLAREGGETDMGFLTMRVALSGPGMRVMVARVTPIFAQVLGRKIAAQAVPVLGAVAGAATNYIYTSYYQDIARVRFGLMALARDRGLDHDDLVRSFKEMVREDRIAAA